jgi:hypothetical protein
MSWITDRVHSLLRTALGRTALGRGAPAAPPPSVESTAVESPVALSTVMERPAPAPAEQLSLGRDAAGTSYVLNLATGGIDALAPAVDPSPVPSADASHAHRSPMLAPMLAPVEPIAQITRDRLAQILHAGGYQVERDVDGDIVACTEIGEVLVVADGRREMVRFLRTFVLRDDVTPRSRLLLANRLNAKGLVARYYIGIESDLVVECDIVCATGLDPTQLLATLRLFTTHVERMLTSGRTRRYFA